ncbi:MAG TPA: hypothetical protein VIY29_23405 [Ktedonobacteraceae bacterium]
MRRLDDERVSIGRIGVTRDARDECDEAIKAASVRPEASPKRATASRRIDEEARAQLRAIIEPDLPRSAFAADVNELVVAADDAAAPCSGGAQVVIEARAINVPAVPMRAKNRVCRVPLRAAPARLDLVAAHMAGGAERVPHTEGRQWHVDCAGERLANPRGRYQRVMEDRDRSPCVGKSHRSCDASRPRTEDTNISHINLLISWDE